MARDYKLFADLKRSTPAKRPNNVFFDFCESGSWTRQTFRRRTIGTSTRSDCASVFAWILGAAAALASKMIGRCRHACSALPGGYGQGCKCADWRDQSGTCSGKVRGLPVHPLYLSINSIEDVGGARRTKPFWFQLLYDEGIRYASAA